VLSAAFNVAMLLKNLLQHILSNLPENLAACNIGELIAMFGEIWVEAARQRNYRNDDVTKLDDLRLLIANSYLLRANCISLEEFLTSQLMCSQRR